MENFMDELKEQTKEEHEIQNSTITGKELARKYKEELKGIPKDKIAKKVEETAKEMPEQVKVQNLTKEKSQVQSVDKDEIE